MFHEIDQLNKEVWQSGTNDPPAGLIKAKEALSLSTSNGYSEGRSDSLLNIGRCQIFLSELKQSKKNLNTALELYRLQSGDRAATGEIRALNALGVVSFELQEYETALNYYFMALTESEASEEDEIRISALNNIGEIHRLLNNREEALSYYHRALQIAENLKNPNTLGITNINLGEIYLVLNDLSEASEYFSKALKISEDNAFQQMKADALLGQGKTLLNKEQEKSEEMINEALNIYENIGDRVSVAECNYQLGAIEYEKNNFDTAENFFTLSNTSAGELNHPELQSKCMLKLSGINKKNSRFEESLRCHEEFYRLEESLSNESLRNRLKKITILYETEQTETEKEAYRMQSLKLERSNKEIKFINEIGRQITSSLELDEIIYNTFIRLSEIVDISSFGVALYNEEDNEIFFNNIMEKGEKMAPFTIDADDPNSLAAKCIRNRKPLLVNSRRDAKTHVGEWKHGSGSPSNSAIFMPMEQRGRMIGCLTIQNTKENMYGERELDTVGAVSTFLAIALDNSKAHAEVHKLNKMITNEKQGLEVAYRKIAHMANHDSLTDLPNRHLLNELLERGIKSAKRTKTRLAILYMDLDDFKPINDSHGHESGDDVLKIVANRLLKTLRSSDTVARIGGDEFVAILYDIDSIEGTESVAVKIIKELSKKITLKGKHFKIGVSIGISIYPEHDTEITGLLIKSDEAMYKAKQAGKNQAATYSLK